MKLGREREIQDNFRVKQIRAADTQETEPESQLCQKLLAYSHSNSSTC